MLICVAYRTDQKPPKTSKWVKQINLTLRYLHCRLRSIVTGHGRLELTGVLSMGRVNQTLSQTYLKALLSGDRVASREAIDRGVESGLGAYHLLTELVWPTMELVQSLYRDDRITVTNLNLATR